MGYGIAGYRSVPNKSMNLKLQDELPPDVLAGATLRGNEYGWNISDFPHALKKAEGYELACLGGQFQFRVEDGTCEMYWLASDSTERHSGEPWAEYSKRSCAEVRKGFSKLVNDTDFARQALDWPLLKTKITEGFDPLLSLVFVAYFITEKGFAKLRHDSEQASKVLNEGSE